MNLTLDEQIAALERRWRASRPPSVLRRFRRLLRPRRPVVAQQLDFKLAAANDDTFRDDERRPR